ncbi:1823_t:CDS:1, partial [Funneliformis geosporum]
MILKNLEEFEKTIFSENDVILKTVKQNNNIISKELFDENQIIEQGLIHKLCLSISPKE